MASGNRWPPGFRFHPTDEELILYYLKRKIRGRKLKLHVIAETDVYKHEPEELPGLSILKNGDRQWFFFSPRDRKYPNGSRSNRATRHGYWKATGKDRTITHASRNVGVKKTLVFYRGRAPSGARTDWVMHEYSLHESELNACQNIQDYYVIYKVFEKSGPGPKNGEQYGAPFREEDWVDDDCCPETTSTSDQANHALQTNNVSADATSETAVVDRLINDIGEVRDQTIGQSATQLVPHANVYNVTVAQPAPEPAPLLENVSEFTQHLNALSQFMLDAPFEEATIEEPCTTYAQSTQQNGLESSFDVTQTVTSGLPMCDVPEVTSITSDRFEFPPDIAEDDDFLEIADLVGPSPNQGVRGAMPSHLAGDDTLENSQLTVDGLDGIDLFFDAEGLFNDLAPIGEAVHPNTCPQSQELEFGCHVHPQTQEPKLEFGYHVAPQTRQPNYQSMPNQCPQHQETGSAYQVGVQTTYQAAPDQYQQHQEARLGYLGFQTSYQVMPDQCPQHQEMGSAYQVGFPPQPYQDFGNETWSFDANAYLSTTSEPDQAFLPLPTTGVVYSGISETVSTTTTDMNQKPSGNNGVNEGSSQPTRFSSTLWSFVESIPAAPASACESALANKALQRMSSFSRVRLNAKTAIAAAGSIQSGTVSASLGGGRVKCFFIFSFLAGLFAVLCVFIGSTSSIFGKFHSRINL